jgi:hypothetical protein
MKGHFTMKKLLAMLTVGSLLALTTGCPPAPSSEKVPPHVDHSTSGDHKDKTGDHADKAAADKAADKAAAEKAAADKAAADKAGDKAAADKTAAEKAADKAAADKAAADKGAADTAAADKTKTGKATKIEKDSLMLDGKKIEVPASAEVWIDGKKDELKNVKADSNVTVTMDKDGKVTKVEEKK